jgi:hypothetical protein
VSHDCNVSEVISDCQSHKKLPLYLRVKAPLIQSVIDCACLEPMKFASQEALMPSLATNPEHERLAPKFWGLGSFCDHKSSTYLRRRLQVLPAES